MPTTTAVTAILATLFLLPSALATPSSLTTPTAAPTPNKRALEPRATNSPLPLTDYHYPYADIPYQVNPFDVGRGPQSGYNQCNSTTGTGALCQTGYLTSASDFCLWGSPDTSGETTISIIEAGVVSYCTQDGHGGRLLPEGTITGLQFMRTSAYIQVVGTFNQVNIGLTSDDGGGELDPHGADNLGNPIGGLMYSMDPAFAVNGTYGQINNWNMFVGSDIFCFKACYNNITSPDYCFNQDDLVGCYYNMPSNAYNPGSFTSCEGDLQDEIGQYEVDGKTETWYQPASVGPDYQLPYTPRVPSSSNCQTFASSDLFAVTTAPSVTGTSAPTTTTSSPKATTTSSGSLKTNVGTSSNPSRTGTSTSSGPTTTSKAGPAPRSITIPFTAVVSVILVVSFKLV